MSKIIKAKGSKNASKEVIEKQPDPKEIEAQRLAEEMRRQEEIRKKEEARKSEILTLPTGLVLYLNKYCVEEAWKHPQPKEFITQYIIKLFKQREILSNYESIEITIIAEFHLYNLIFAKEQLELDDSKAVVLMNIFWVLLMHNNPFYFKKIDILQEYDEEMKKEFLSHKSFEDDMAEFRKVLSNHCIDNPPSQTKYFEPVEIKQILEYVKSGYFMHYNLYKSILLNKQKNEEYKITAYVDEPIRLRPLSEALYMGKERHEVKEDDDDELVK
jgi:hypothetical protein